MSGEPTSVYVISCGDLVKIGVSKNPALCIKRTIGTAI